MNLRHTALSNDAIVQLVNDKAHTLRRLNVANTVVNDQGLAQFPVNSQLTRLSLMDTGITDAGCEHITRCKWLTHLRLDLTDVTDDGIRFLADCDHLKKLELNGTRVSDVSPVWLSDSGIEHLGLGATRLTDAGVPALTEFSELRSLDLQRTEISDRGLRFLSEAPLVDRLFVEYTNISNAGIEFLLKLPLQSVSLNPKLNDRGLDILSNHETLRRLAVWDAAVTSWQSLSRLNELEVLLIDDSVRDLSPLQSLQQLKVLMLWGSDFSSVQLAKLRTRLPKCRIKQFPRYKCPLKEFRSLCLGGGCD